MRVITIAGGAGLLVAAQLMAQHVPYPEFYISVTTGTADRRDSRKETLAVQVQCIRKREAPFHRTEIDVNCYKFDASARGFTPEEQQVFIEAAGAAEEGRSFSRTVESRTIPRRQLESTIESRQISGAWQVVVQRGEEEAVFDSNEGAHLREALAEASAGAAWFHRLLSDEPLPQPTAEMHPPRLVRYFLISRVGAVDCNGFNYEISANGNGGPPEYYTGHTIAFGREGQRGSIGRNWGAALLPEAERALEALERNQDYQFLADDRTFRLEANRQTRDVDVTIARRDFFTDRSPVVGRLTRERLDEIRALIAESEKQQAWFAEHEALFFAK